MIPWGAWGAPGTRRPTALAITTIVKGYGEGHDGGTPDPLAYPPYPALPGARWQLALIIQRQPAAVLLVLPLSREEQCCLLIACDVGMILHF